jgi:hypothetical protein
MGLSDLVTVLVTVAVTVAVVAVTWSASEEKRQFMRECQDDRHEHYACTAMWRGGAAFYRLTLPMDVN